MRLINILVSLSLAAVLSGAASWAQELRIIPVPPQVRPQWTPVPGAPKVYYAPNLPTDLFRYRGSYYFYWEGYLYKGKTPQGPWKSVKEAPPFFYQIDPAYFKTVRKGEKGGEGGPTPPGAGPAPPAGVHLPAGEGTSPPGGAAGTPTGAPAVPGGPPAAPEGTPPPPKVM